MRGPSRSLALALVALCLAALAAAGRTHAVRAGESLTSVAKRYDVSIAALAAANDLRDTDHLRRGQVLLIPSRTPVASSTPAPEPAKPAPARTHVVRSGETLSAIAGRHGVTVRDLARANRLRDADRLLRGQRLVIPEGAPAFIEHVVARGETLGSIAARYKVAPADIRTGNSLKNPDLIKPGQVLRIAGSDTAAAEAAPSAPPPPAAEPPGRRLPAAIQAALDSARVRPGRWKHLVIHHSATNEGSGAGMDRYHREERRMENGLAYHFVVGNGNGMTDGSIFVGRRWNEQLAGGHVVSPELNEKSIGICLVGDFEKRPPTRRQMASLEALCRALLRRAALDHSAVTTHRHIHPGHTLCPGRHFPAEHLRQALRAP